MNEQRVDCEDLQLSVDQLLRQGFLLELIYPADDPHTALLERAGRRVRLTTRPDADAPGEGLPPFAPEFVLSRDGGEERRGRAGMLYRDLIPSRLGGRYIASRISIHDASGLEDWVHFHRIAIQVLVVRRGWVRVAYEDQGEPIVMREGDLVLQPPGIRHRVLESSDGLEVIELTAPANHATFADHDLELPGPSDPMRTFGTQRFLHHVSATRPWRKFSGGGEVQDSALLDASGGLAEARRIRAAGASTISFPPHQGEISFAFLLEGSARLNHIGTHEINAGDSFVIPPGNSWTLDEVSGDLDLLHLSTGGLD